MNYLKSLRQARARDVYTNIMVRTTGNILRWKTQFKHPLVSDSFLAIWSPLVNLMIELQACIDSSFLNSLMSTTNRKTKTNQNHVSKIQMFVRLSKWKRRTSR